MRNKTLIKIKYDSYYNQLIKEELTTELQKIHEAVSDDIDQMRYCLTKYQRKRHWLLWHDHVTIASYGHRLFLPARTLWSYHTCDKTRNAG